MRARAALRESRRIQSKDAGVPASASQGANGVVFARCAPKPLECCARANIFEAELRAGSARKSALPAVVLDRVFIALGLCRGGHCCPIHFIGEQAPGTPLSHCSESVDSSS